MKRVGRKRGIKMGGQIKSQRNRKKLSNRKIISSMKK